MRKKGIIKKTIFLAILSFSLMTNLAKGFDFSLSEKDLHCIGDRVFQNECAGDPEKLVYWNAHEPFPSLGIGHFIWYAENFKGRFHESFPELVRFLKSKGAAVPDWLWDDGNIKFPWRNREEFLADQSGQKISELKHLLKNTKDLQTLFMLEKLRKFHSTISVGLFFSNKNPLRERFERLTRSTQGVYLLMDYLNFKGDGLTPSERYKGYGWGLKQVLEEMNEGKFKKDPIAEFSKTAYRVLERRVKNSDPKDKEGRWLQGWKKRALSYSAFSC